jgi:Saxitoxin biosynthesis operon protein SxtJ
MSLIRIERNPTGRQLLVFGAAWLVFFGAWGLLAWRHGRSASAEALWTLAAVVPAAGAVSRPILRLAYVGMSYVTYPVGFVVSYVVLALVFFLVLTPIGLVMRLFGHDPLTRKFDPAAKTYWIPRDGTRTVESYFKQG